MKIKLYGQVNCNSGHMLRVKKAEGLQMDEFNKI